MANGLRNYRLLKESLRKNFLGSTSGNVVITFALCLPVLFGAVSVGVELKRINQAQSKLQQYADSAALAGARELRLGNASRDTILSVVRNYVASNVANDALAVSVQGSVRDDNSQVTVNLAANLPAGLGAAIGLTPSTVAATATAKVMGGTPLCLVGLNKTSSMTVSLDKNARLEARGCAVYNNSKHPNGLKSKQNAQLNAAFICSAGGKDGGQGNFTPQPEIDCPQLPDPLALRPAPPTGSCLPENTNLKISGEVLILQPGTYCGNVSILNKAEVTLSPGIYVFSNGQLIVDTNARLTGSSVALYFTGANAGLQFKKNSFVSLTAPVDGLLAGLLIYQDRSITKEQTFDISSDNANVLLGTIYLPRGRLYMGGDSPVGGESAYTIVVANRVEAEAGPTIVLNSNYNATNVPVPDGVGPFSTGVRLIR